MTLSTTARSVRVAHLDCASGVSGDMCVGALVDAGLVLNRLRAGLVTLGIRGYTLRAGSVRRAGLRGTRVEVVIPRPQRLGFDRMIRTTRLSRLPETVKAQAVAVFTRLRRVEAKVHGSVAMVHDRGRGIVHRHDARSPALGDLDTLIDVVGTVLGLHLLGVSQVTASPLNTGMHLAPASAELLRGLPIYSTDLPYELTTPTGAALIATLARQVGPMPPMRLTTIGVGAGRANPPQAPNLLRLLIGEPYSAALTPMGSPPYVAETVLVVETDIDDLNPQVYEYLIRRLFRAGALDVTLTPLIMKKGRPGTRLTLLSPHERLPALAEIIFGETTTLGLRIHEVERLKVARTSRTMKTRHGPVRVKIAARDGRVIATPEYEDCRRIAEATGRPLKQVMEDLQQRLARTRMKMTGE